MAIVSLRGEPITPPGEPDDEAVTLAREVLERVESGDCNGIVVVLSYADGAVGHMMAGGQLVNHQVLGALSRAMHEMHRYMDGTESES